MKNNESQVKSSAAIEELVLEKETEALNNWAEGNVTGYIIHFDNDASYMDDMGAHHRIDGLQAIRAYMDKVESSGVITKHRYEIIKPRVQVYQDTAILTLQYHPFELDDTPGTKWKATVIYVLSDNDWKVVHAHWSMIKEE